MGIDLHSELTFRNSFKFPIQNALARREVLFGAVLVLVPLVGWLLNMGHRIEMVHRMHHEQPAWPSWNNYGRLLRSGIITFLGMVYYYLPGAVLGIISFHTRQPWLGVLASVLLLLATVAIPGYMTHYCRNYDAREYSIPSDPSTEFFRVVDSTGRLGPSQFARLLCRSLDYWLLESDF